MVDVADLRGQDFHLHRSDQLAGLARRVRRPSRLDRLGFIDDGLDPVTLVVDVGVAEDGDELETVRELRENLEISSLGGRLAECLQVGPRCKSLRAGRQRVTAKVHALALSAIWLARQTGARTIRPLDVFAEDLD